MTFMSAGSCCAIVTIPELIAKWRKVELKERSAAQEHFIDLCHVFEHPTPAAYDQLPRYRNALENPPLLAVCDIDRTLVHTNFTGTASVIRLL